MQSVICPECNTEWEVDGDGELFDQGACNYPDCPVMDGTQFATPDASPLNFREEAGEPEYEPDFFDNIEEIDDD